MVANAMVVLHSDQAVEATLLIQFTVSILLILLFGGACIKAKADCFIVF